MKLILLLSLISTVAGAQFTVDSFQDVYEPLDDYTSIGIETMGYTTFSEDFELDFIFPFMDTIYDYINCDSGGTCVFHEEKGITFRLFSFIYESDEILDTVDIQSDFRYALRERDGIKSLTIEYYNARLNNDPSVDEFDSRVNFQMIIYETGAVEIRFGEIDLDNSPLYVPGSGFRLTNGLFLGPNVGIIYRGKTVMDQEGSGIGIEGLHDDYTVRNQIGRLVDIPPSGWVIRFEPSTTPTNNVTESDILLLGNPVGDFLYLKSDDSELYNVRITNSYGHTQYQGQMTSGSNDVSSLSSGIYYLQILSGNYTKAIPFLKQ